VIHTDAGKIASLFAPFAILASAYLLLPRISLLPPPWNELIPYAPVPITVVGLLLSLQFRRGRVFLALLLAAALYLAVNAPIFGWGTDISADNTAGLLSLLIPFNITLFMFMRERGAMTVAGRLRLAFLALQGLIVWRLILRHENIVAGFLRMEIFPTPLHWGITIPHPALLLLIPSLIISMVRLAIRISPVNGALVGALIAMAAVLSFPSIPTLPSVFLTAAVLTLTLGILQDSHDMAFRDELTGLSSRRALNDRLSELGRRYVVAMLDIDHFKGFNDAYGHDVGDQVLKMVGKKIQGVRGGGRAYRYGGEEFTVIFPRMGVDEAIPYLEEVRKAIGEYQLVLRDSTRPEESRIGKRFRGSGEGETVSVTISIGVAENGDRSIPAEVLKEADQALYRAKRKGRNILSR
jgi:diguanylate cyclase (GGDEF)-like protein